MKKEDHDKIISSIQEKAGDEVSGVIADDLGLLITDNSNMLDIIEKQSKQIEKLEKQNNNSCNPATAPAKRTYYPSDPRRK